MEQKIIGTKIKLASKSQRMMAMVTTHQNQSREKENLDESIENRSGSCKLKKQNLAYVRDVMSKESETIQKSLQVVQTKRSEKLCRKLDGFAGHLSHSLANMERLEKVAPVILDDRSMRSDLQSAREKMQKLGRECAQKRQLVQKIYRDRMSEYHKLVESTQTIMDVLWEQSQAKKGEEEADAIAHQQNLGIIRKNQETRTRINNKSSFNIFRM